MQKMTPHEIRMANLIFSDTSQRPVANRLCPCLLCGKPFMMLPFIGTPDQLCPACGELYADAARVVCSNPKCKVTIMRIAPRQQPDSGYYIRPKAILHVAECYICHPGIKSSVIVEIDEWLRTQRPAKLYI